MKVEIDITEEQIKDLKVIRTYFGANDKTMLEHMAYKLLDDLVKKLSTPIAVPVPKRKLCKHSPDFIVYADREGLDVCTSCGASKLAQQNEPTL